MEDAASDWDDGFGGDCWDGMISFSKSVGRLLVGLQIWSSSWCVPIMNLGVFLVDVIIGVLADVASSCVVLERHSGCQPSCDDFHGI